MNQHDYEPRHGLPYSPLTLEQVQERARWTWREMYRRRPMHGARRCALRRRYFWLYESLRVRTNGGPALPWQADR